MTAPFALPPDARADADRELTRQLARGRLAGLRAECQALAARLATDHVDGRWHGAAQAMYRARLAEVAHRVPAALAAIAAAERALRVP